MKSRRKFHDKFYVIFVEYRQLAYEIYDNAKMDICMWESSPKLQDRELKRKKDIDFLMAEDLKDNEVEVEKNVDLEVAQNISNIEMKGSNYMSLSMPDLNALEKIFNGSEAKAAAEAQANGFRLGVHDICAKDVRDICIAERTIQQVIPCGTNGGNGCRGGFSPDGPPVVESYRLLCAEERLSPETGCDRIINSVEFQVVLRYNENSRVVITPSDEFPCFWYDFFRFPSGDYYSNCPEGLEEFRNELALIDGSCKVVEIIDVRVEVQGDDCILIIEYEVADKLWKHENLIVLAVKPFGENITVSNKFCQGHDMACTDNTVIID